MPVRPETPADAAAIAAVHRAAFGREAEAALVAALRAAGVLAVTMVAEVEGRVVGHVAFSPVTLPDAPAGVRAVGLGPLAVLAARRRRGLGAALVAAGLDACAAAGWALAVVLGEPDYYARFGFEPAARLGLRLGLGAPPAAFQAKPLAPALPALVPGVVRYHPAFDGL